MSMGIQLFFILICLFGAAFFSGMETGVIAIHRLRLRHLMRRGVRGAHIIHRFHTHPDHLLGTTLVGANICTVVSSVMATSVATAFLGKWGPLTSGLIMTPVLLIGCEYLPKAWFQSRPAARAVPAARLLNMFGYVFHPLGWLVTSVVNLILPSSIRRGHDLHKALTRDDLKYLTRESEQGGSLTPDERRMIHGVFALTHKSGDEIMVPREKMVEVSADTSREDLLAVGRTRGFTRLPVYQEAPDQIVGVVHLLDVAADESGEAKTARNYMRPPQFAPVKTDVDALLPRMRLVRHPIIFLTDAHSKVVGMVTLEDVLEEIVGEL